MKAVVLAIHEDYISGSDKPLALMRLCGVPLIVRTLYTIKSAGIRDVLIVLGHKGSMITELLGNGVNLNMNIKYLDGTRSRDILEDFLDDDLTVIYDNVIFDVELIREVYSIDGCVICYYRDNPVGIYKVDKGFLSKLRISSRDISLDRLIDSIEEENIVKLDVSRIEREYLELKRIASPICVKLYNKASLEEAKKMIVFRTQKGLHFTAYMNKPIEDRIIYFIAEMTWITPNRITLLANLMAFTVAILLLIADLSVASILAYIVGIIDGLDGKLARARGIFTKLGYIEHSFDMLYEQLWYACFAVRLYQLGYGYLPFILGLSMLIVDSFVRHCYMQFRQVMGKALTVYSRFDRVFALVDGRRNVYVLYMIFFSVVRAPLYAVYAMLIHSSITAIIYSIRAVKHMDAVDRADGTKSFLKLVSRR